MFGFHSTRAIRRRCHQAIVWAMVPLAVFNGRTLVACGCTGQFSSVCHCQASGAGQVNAQAKAATCAKCAAHAATAGARSTRPHSCCMLRPTAAGNDKADAARHVVGHHCRSVATYEVIPGTTVSSHADDQLTAADSLAIASVQPRVFDQDRTAALPSPEAHPPDDLVVVLHRLVI